MSPPALPSGSATFGSTFGNPSRRAGGGKTLGISGPVPETATARLPFLVPKEERGDQNGRSSSSASSASGTASNDSAPLEPAAPAAPAATRGAEKLSEFSPRPESRMSSRALISVV